METTLLSLWEQATNLRLSEAIGYLKYSQEPMYH